MLDLLNLEVADSTPHTRVQTHKRASMLNQPTSDDFHMVTFRTNKLTHTQTDQSCPRSTSLSFKDLLFGL